MKNAFLIIALSLTIGIKAQNLTKLDFSKTEWFTNNDNGEFFTADKISLMKISELNTENGELNRKYINLHRNQRNNFIEFSFKNNNKLAVKNLNIEQWSTSKIKGNWRYEFDSKNQILKFYLDNKLHSSFKFISEINESMKWITEKDNSSKESIVNLKKMNFARLNN
jgi:hypothetical protein